jgi:hypothetical protein
MSDLTRPNAFDPQAPPVDGRFPPLPWWIARRLLKRGEEVTWVVGPRFNPSWERYVTDPLLFVASLALAGLCLGVGWLIGGTVRDMPLAPALLAGGLVFGTIFLLGFCSGYFTRLVVTNRRLVILQGREICRNLGLDELPPSLLRYRGAGRPTVDLDAVKEMLGGTSDTVAGAKAIVEFGKHLDRIKIARDNVQP